VKPARFSAIWCAASDAGSIRPASAEAIANTPTSSVNWPAAGAPSATSRRSRAASIDSGVSSNPGRRCRSRRTITTKSDAAIVILARTVAQADPATPSAGAPRLP
jgi:hypothetical protein